MRTQTFRARTVHDAMRLARETLGPEAYLVSSQRITEPDQDEARFAVSFAFRAEDVVANNVKDEEARVFPAAASGGLADAELRRDTDKAPRSSTAFRTYGGWSASSEAAASTEDAGGKAEGSSSRRESDQSLRRNLPRKQSEAAEADSLSIPPVRAGKAAGETLDGRYHSARAVHRSSFPLSRGMLDAKRGQVAEEIDKNPSHALMPDCGFSVRAVTRNERIPTPQPAALVEIQTEMLSMKRDLAELLGSVRKVRSQVNRDGLAHECLRSFYDLLVEQEFGSDVIDEILGKVDPSVLREMETEETRKLSKANSSRVKGRSRRTAGDAPANGRKRLEASSADAMSPVIQDAVSSVIDLMPEPGFRRRTSAPTVISLIGPPGAGKTTTLVKLAVRYGELCSRPVQIVSMDNYRVAANDQLLTYASILGVGFEALSSVNSLAKALESYRSKEVILIDTPGLGSRDFDAAGDLPNFISGLDDAITHLVVPASMKSCDLARIADLYAAFRYDALLFTRMDETSSIGSLVTESRRRRVPFSYFCLGQRIPEDIEIATRQTICDRVVSRADQCPRFAA